MKLSPRQESDATDGAKETMESIGTSIRTIGWASLRPVLVIAKAISRPFKGSIPKDGKVFFRRAWRHLRNAPKRSAKGVQAAFRKVKTEWATREEAKIHPSVKWGWRTAKAMIVAAVTIAGVASIRSFFSAVSTPETGWLYAMDVAMPDGSNEVKFGMTSRTPEERVRELNADSGREGIYSVHAKEEVDLDVMMTSEKALLEEARAISGDPTVGLEQFDGIPLEDAQAMLETAEIAGEAIL